MTGLIWNVSIALSGALPGVPAPKQTFLRIRCLVWSRSICMQLVGDAYVVRLSMKKVQKWHDGIHSLPEVADVESEWLTGLQERMGWNDKSVVVQILQMSRIAQRPKYMHAICFLHDTKRNLLRWQRQRCNMIEENFKGIGQILAFSKTCHGSADVCPL